MFPWMKAKGWVLLPGICLAASVQAGQLQLTNGDVINGELTKVQGDLLVWKSESFGELKVKKSKVVQLQTATALKINGHKQPCHVEGMDAGNVSYRCDDGDQTSISLMTLDNVQPFETFAAGAYEYEGKLSIAGVFSNGNKEEEDWDINASTRFRQGEFRHVTKLYYESESVNNGPVDEQFEAAYRLDWFFSEKWFWYNQLSTGADDTKNLDEQYLFGSGVGYQVWKTADGFLDVEFGAEYIKDLYDPTAADLLDPDYESTDEHTSLRYATDFKYPLNILGSASLIHKNELLYSMEDSEDWQLSADTGVNIPLGAGLFSEFMFEYDYDNQPSGDNEKTDTKLTVGVGYQW